MFVPVVRYETLRFLLAYVAKMDWVLQKVDVKTAFLYGKLDEELFMDVSPIPKEVMASLAASARHEDVIGQLSTKDMRDCALKLNKSIYGMRQAALKWHETLKDFLQGHGYEQASSDPCLFIGTGKLGKRRFVLVYVDDIIIAASSISECLEVERFLKERFDISSMERAHFFLGVKLTLERSKNML